MIIKRGLALTQGLIFKGLCNKIELGIFLRAELIKRKPVYVVKPTGLNKL